MSTKSSGPAKTRNPTMGDLAMSLRKGVSDFAQAPLIGMFFAGFYVVTGLLIAWVTYLSGHTYWLVLAVLGFPLIGSFAAIGFYETSRRRECGELLSLEEIAGAVWSERGGQLSWLAAFLMVLLLFWFFLGHMIFAVFLGTTQMTNIFSSLEVVLSSTGLLMLTVGTAFGAVFAILIFAGTVLGIPMLVDRDVDFVSAFLRSIQAVRSSPVIYLGWGLFIGLLTLVAILPFFLGLFVVLPIFGHATWHLYRAVVVQS